MSRENDCGCGQHEERSTERHEGHPEKDCSCGGHEHHGHHGMNRGSHHEGNCGCGGHGHGGMPHPGCNCPCHHMGMHGRMGMGFGRRFISREEIITRLEEYQKQLEAEAKGVEERIAELKKQGEPQQA